MWVLSLQRPTNLPKGLNTNSIKYRKGGGLPKWFSQKVFRVEILDDPPSHSLLTGLTGPCLTRHLRTGPETPSSPSLFFLLQGKQMNLPGSQHLSCLEQTHTCPYVRLPDLSVRCLSSFVRTLCDSEVRTFRAPVVTPTETSGTLRSQEATSPRPTHSFATFDADV